MKLERLLFSAFASATNFTLRAFSILNDIVVSFIAFANNTANLYRLQEIWKEFDKPSLCW